MMKGTSGARKALTKSIVLGLTIGMFGGFTIVSAQGENVLVGDDSGVGSVAIGDNSTATGTDSVAIGGGTASGSYDLAIAGGKASGDGGVALGNAAVSKGFGSIVIANKGFISTAYSDNDIVIGNASDTCDTSVDPAAGGNFVIGSNSHIKDAHWSMAIGDLSNITASNSVAIGTGTIISNENSVALGVNSHTSAANIGTTAQGSSITIAGETINRTYAGIASEAKGTVSVGRGTGAERQIQNVAAGDVTTTSTDAVNGSQLAATNQAVQDVADKIGNVTTTTNGVSNTNTVGQNIDAINNAIGTTADGEYVKADKTVGENLNTLDEHVKTNADNIASNTSRIDAIEQSNSTITGDITNIQGDVTEINNRLDTGYTFGGDIGKDGKPRNNSVGVGNEVTVAGDGKNISTIFSQDTATGNATIQVTMDSNPDFDSLKIGGDTYIDSNGLNANGKKISNVSAGNISATSTDAVNGSQIFNSVGDVNNYTSNNYVTNGSSLVENVSNLDQQVGTNTDNISKIGNNINNISNNISGISNKLNNLDSRVNKVGASSAALAALHPLEFDPGDKWNFAAGYGNYQGSNAMAIGAFYRPNEDTMFSLGTTLGNGENMINVGVSFKIGSGNHLPTSRTMMAKEIEELRQKDMNHMTEIEELRQQVNKLTEMISSNK